jgi:hypothetical protein
MAHKKPNAHRGPTFVGFRPKKEATKKTRLEKQEKRMRGRNYDC